MKKIIQCCLVIATVTSSAMLYAKSATDDFNCPSPDAIAATPFDAVGPVPYSEVWGGGIKRNTFGTDKEWSFILLGEKAKNQKAAEKLLNHDKQKLVADGTAQDPDGTIYCIYKVSDNETLKGFTVNPPLPEDMSLQTIKVRQ